MTQANGNGEPGEPRHPELPLDLYVQEPWDRFGILISRYYWTEHHRFENTRPPLDPESEVFKRVWDRAGWIQEPYQKMAVWRGVRLLLSYKGAVTFFPGPRPVDGICELYEFLRDETHGVGLAHTAAVGFLRRLELVFLEAEAAILADRLQSLPTRRERIAQVKIFQAGKYREMTADIYVDFSKNKGGEIVCSGHPELSVVLEHTITRVGESVAAFFTYISEVRGFTDHFNRYAEDQQRNFETLADDLDLQAGYMQGHQVALQGLVKDVRALSKQIADSGLVFDFDQLKKVLAEAVREGNEGVESLLADLNETQQFQTQEIVMQGDLTRGLLKRKFDRLERAADETNARLFSGEVGREILQARLNGLESGQAEILASLGDLRQHLAMSTEQVVGHLVEIEAWLESISQSARFNKIQARARDKMIRILLVVADRGPAPAREVSTLTGIPLNLTYHYLDRLRAMALLRRVLAAPEESGDPAGEVVPIANPATGNETNDLGDPDPTAPGAMVGGSQLGRIRRAFRRIYRYIVNARETKTKTENEYEKYTRRQDHGN